ncbi:MAG: redoxin domain-containing protein [archaeon]
MTLSAGDQAPDFTLVDVNRKIRRLSEFRGKKTVLAFFPGAFTSVCTKELCTLRDSMANFERLNSQIVAVSVNDPFTLKAFSEANKLSFPLLSDYRREVVTRFEIAAQNFAGLDGYTAAKRSVFVLDSQGKIVYKWVSEDPSREPDYGELEKTLNEAE